MLVYFNSGIKWIIGGKILHIPWTTKPDKNEAYVETIQLWNVNFEGRSPNAGVSAVCSILCFPLSYTITQEFRAEPGVVVLGFCRLRVLFDPTSLTAHPRCIQAAALAPKVVDAAVRRPGALQG